MTKHIQIEAEKEEEEEEKMLIDVIPVSSLIAIIIII